MHSKVTREGINELLNHQDGKVISIYLPTHRHSSPQFIQEDQTRFKNCITQAHNLWRDHGESERDISEEFKELESFHENSSFWQQTTEALAIFVGDGQVRAFRMPIECEERVVVGDSYDVTPLLIADSLNQPYYVLAVGMRDPRILKGDIYGLEDLDIDMPKDAHEALNIDEMHSNTMVRNSTQRGSASSAHGEGSSVELGHEERSRYFKMIEQSIVDSGSFDQSLPVLLAGTDNEVGDFRAGSKLPWIVPDDYIGGSHTETSAHDIHEMARPIVHRACIKPKWQEASDRFNEMMGTGKASFDPDQIAVASREGRVDTLVIATMDVTRDSVSDAATEPAPMLRKPDSNMLDKVVAAARDAARSGAVILGLEKGEYLPEDIEMAAVYRY